MGLLIHGQWVDQWYDTKKTGGHFVRQDSQFRHLLGSKHFPVEKNRYCLMFLTHVHGHIGLNLSKVKAT